MSEINTGRERGGRDGRPSSIYRVGGKPRAEGYKCLVVEREGGHHIVCVDFAKWAKG